MSWQGNRHQKNTIRKYDDDHGDCSSDRDRRPRQRRRKSPDLLLDDVICDFQRDGGVEAYEEDGDDRIVADSTLSKKSAAAATARRSLAKRVSNPSPEDDVDDDNSDIVVQRVDEWLKNRSDSLSSIEFESDIKNTVEEEYEFAAAANVANEIAASEVNRSVHMSDLFSLTDSINNNNVEKSSGGGDSERPTFDGGLLRSTPAGGAADSKHGIQISEIVGNFSMDEFVEMATSAAVKREDYAAKNVIPQLNIPEGVEIPTECVDLHEAYCQSKLSSVQFCATDKGIMLMTPQELENMPESGIEFEESVGPKEEMQALICQVEHGNAESPLAESENQPLTATAETSSGGAPTLATISISTDDETNTTSIVIRTKQGQQEFKINTTNLMQAAATLQPITLADLVDQKGGISILGDQQVILDSPAGDLAQSNVISSAKDVVSTFVTSLHESKTAPATTGCIQDETGAKNSICTHTGRCKKVWACPDKDCGKMYTKQCKLKVHMMMHSGVRPYKCEVQGCDWAFTTVYKLKRHLETHCGSKDFICEVCDRRFTTIYNLKSHKKLHAQANSVSCPIENCCALFPTRRKMELHLKTHSEVDAPYKCPNDSCGKTYYTANSMASHLRIHQKANLQCTFDGCNKIFDKMSRYKVHMWKHTGEKPYICTHQGCTWAFSSASKLKRHMRKHTGERQYTCEEPGCGKSFMRLEHLQGHTVTHSGDKPFKCPHENCSARFTAKSSLYVHVKKHDISGEKIVYPCPAENCDKKYNCKSSLRIHMLRYHTPVLADAGQLDFVTLLPNIELPSDITAVECYDPTIQQNTISVAVRDSRTITATDGQEFILPHDDPGQSVVCEQTDLLPVNGVVTPSVIEGDEDGVKSAPVAQTVSNPHSTVTDVIVMPSSTSDLDSLGAPSLLQKNNSGSARTDFCSNHILVDRVRRRRQLQQAKLNLESNVGPDVESKAVPLTSSSDVVLTSTAITFRSSTPTGVHFIQNPLLPDDPPPSHGELYQEDGLLTSMANELAVPISLLAEANVTDSSGSAQNTTDFGSSSSSAEFTGTTINLQDLE